MNSRKPKQSRPRYLTFWIFDHTFEVGVRLRLIIRAIIKASKTIRVSKSFFGKPVEMQTMDSLPVYRDVFRLGFTVSISNVNSLENGP